MTHPSDLLLRDARCVWHPFTQHGVEQEPLPVAGALDATLLLEDGSEVLDAISSWWACLHGHGQSRLIEAAKDQARVLDHVLFAGATHEPAVRLAERLVEEAPPGLSRVFYSDNGSTAVEVALKMVYQAWAQAGEPGRAWFVALEGGYHGDTFGAMAVGDPDPFFEVYKPLLFQVKRVAPDAAAVQAALEELGTGAAGVIVEPLLQAAGGMRMHSPGFVKRVRELCTQFGVPLIADEVMTGFGRTGALFACTRAGVTPDLMCLAKGLTGGFFPLAATLATEPYFEAFRSHDRSRAFFHGHTFTAHPVGCAVALESLAMCLEDHVPARLERIGGQIERALQPLARESDKVHNLRRVGGVVALDLPLPEGRTSGYLADRALTLRREAVRRGVLLRPLGNVLYAMPPACTTPEEADRIAAVMRDLVELW